MNFWKLEPLTNPKVFEHEPSISRVVHVTSWLTNRGGGIPPVVFGLGREMAQNGVECVVVGLANEPADAPEQSGLITVLSAPGRGPLLYAPKLRPKIASSISGDCIVHIHGLWAHPGVLARQAAAAKGVPLVISAHGMLDEWALKNSAWKKRLAGLFFENRNLREADCLHALCESEARSYRQYGLKNPICIIPNGIDLSAAAASEPHARTVDAADVNPLRESKERGRKVLLYLGRIHPKKGLANLIRAWAVTQSSEWDLAIAGWDQDGHSAELQRLCTELGVAIGGQPELNGASGRAETVLAQRRSGAEKRAETNGPSGREKTVYFLGPQFGEDKAACYRHCDAFILPSLSEGLPMVVLEAWAWAKPVLMTPQCNLPEGFNAKAAIRIEPTAESIAQGLKTLFLASSEELRTMGMHGRSLIETVFNWGRCARDMISVYQWLLGAGSKPAGIFYNEK